MGEIIRSLDALFPPLAEKTLTFKTKIEPHRFFIFETYRSFENQMENYKKGRELKNNEWVVVDPKQIVTKAKPGMGLHSYGLALDIAVDGNIQKQGVQWNWDDYDTIQPGIQKIPWDIPGKIGKDLGFEWAGDWTSFKEMPHFQNRYGYKISELYPILINDGLEAVWKMIMKKIKPETILVPVTTNITSTLNVPTTTPPAHIIAIDEKESTAASSIITKPGELNKIIKTKTTKSIFSFALSKLNSLLKK